MVTLNFMNKDFTEYPDWKKNIPRTGVTWNGECTKCEFRVENAPFDNKASLGITGNGRRLARCITRIVINSKVFISEEEEIYCSVCVPNIL